jgi:hypothetical protein
MAIHFLAQWRSQLGETMKGNGLRTVKWWVRYWPPGRFVIKRQYGTKAAALRERTNGEVVFQVKGHYVGDVK